MTKYLKSFFASYYGLFIATTFLFIYIPIFILIVFSFNSVAYPYRWAGFSIEWYQELFQSEEIWHVVKNSFIVAFCSVFLSLIMGTLLVFYTAGSRLRYVLSIFYINLLLPEIILAVSLLSFFVLCDIPTGLLTLIAGHTVLGLAYVVPILSARLTQMNPSLIEASLDLGATINQTFYRIIIPFLLPAIIAAGLLVFVISFDDFLLAFFCAGAESQTLPLYIFATIRTGISPYLNALSTLLLVLSSLFVLIFCWLQAKIRVY